MIQISIPTKVLKRIADQNEVLCSTTLLEAMRHAGIPVAGSLMLRGVRSGSLSMWINQGMAYYSWESEDEVRDPDERHFRLKQVRSEFNNFTIYKTVEDSNDQEDNNDEVY